MGGVEADLVTLDVDVNKELARQYEARLSDPLSCATGTHLGCALCHPWIQVRAMPTVIAFRNGRPVGQFVGALPLQQVRAFVEKVTG